MAIFERFTNWLMGLRRQWVQLGATLLFNSYFFAPWTKSIPCIGFNCYACPLATTACPIGSLQHFGIIRRVPFYLLGFLGLVGVLIGRLACGWFCPFGFLQELMYKIPLPKLRMSNRLARFRYVIFALLVVIIPIITYEPWFCKLCPAGALEAGVPLVVIDAEIRALTGLLFGIKMLILAGFLLWFVVTTRPFCRFICPLGSIYTPFNSVSGVKLHFHVDHCLGCDDCAKVCPTELHPPTEIDSEGCIRCLECLKVCPVGALSSSREAVRLEKSHA